MLGSRARGLRRHPLRDQGHRHPAADGPLRRPEGVRGRGDRRASATSPGAVVGGLLLGLVEEFVVGYTASSWRDAVAFGFLIVVLLVKPEGLFGRAVAGEGVSRDGPRPDGPPRRAAGPDRAPLPGGARPGARARCRSSSTSRRSSGVNIILAVSLNIVNGMTGQFSIGHAGFMAVGAYMGGKLSLALSSMAISGLPVPMSDQMHVRASRSSPAAPLRPCSASSWASPRSASRATISRSSRSASARSSASSCRTPRPSGARSGSPGIPQYLEPLHGLALGLPHRAGRRAGSPPPRTGRSLLGGPRGRGRRRGDGRGHHRLQGARVRDLLVLRRRCRRAVRALRPDHQPRLLHVREVDGGGGDGGGGRPGIDQRRRGRSGHSSRFCRRRCGRSSPRAQATWSMAQRVDQIRMPVYGLLLVA